MTRTPTDKDFAADARKRKHLPCPHCGLPVGANRVLMGGTFDSPRKERGAAYPRSHGGCLGEKRLVLPPF